MRQTPLHELHRRLGARFIDYAGYRLPVHYGGGVIEEHLHVREQAGLFDVSHLGQLQLAGPNLAAALEALVPADLQSLRPGQLVYSMLTNDNGGVRDDLVLHCLEREHFQLAVNAAVAQQDADYLRECLPAEIEVLLRADCALLSLQGPLAAAVMARLIPEANELPFMGGRIIRIDDVECHLMRCGYTGEDGFEIFLPAAAAENFAERLLSSEEVRCIGLGARDTLRLEAGLCLYGLDLDKNTTPAEAGLEWTVSKTRRRNGERAGGFPGAEVILNQIERGAPRRRVGLRALGRAPLRAGVELFDREENPIGAVSSGGFAPSLGAPAAMGYVRAGRNLEEGSVLRAEVRGALQELRVVSLPFVPHRYHRP